MVLEESARLIDGIPQEANVIGWARRPSSQPGLACTSQIEFVEIAYAAQNVNNLSPARASFDGVVSVTHSHFMHVRGSENNSTTEVLVLAGNITLGQLIRVWDGEEYAWGQVTNVTNFVDSATSTYVPITDRGTNFVMESGLIVPMDGQSLIDGVTVHRSYIVWMHNLAMNTKRLAPSIFWDSVFAPMLASESSILDGSCFETIAFFNHLVTALRANDKEGLWLVADPAKSEEFLEWVADHMHELVGLTQTSQDWWVIPASRAAASLALRAVSQVALMTSQSSTPIKLDALYDATVWEEQGQARKCAWNHIGALDFDCGGQSYVEDAMNVQNFSAEFCCAAVADPGGVQAKATVADPVITVCVTTMTFEWPLNATQKAKAISLYAVAVAEGTNINASQVLVTMAATTGRRLLAAASYVFEAKVLTSTSTAMKQVESTEMAEITRLSFEGQQVLEPLLTGYVVATWSPAEDVFKQPAAAAAGTSPVGIAPGIIAVAVIVPLVVIAGLLLWWFCVYRKTSGRRSSSNQVAPLSSAPGQGGLNQRKAAADNR